MSNTTPDPITSQERILVRSTVTGFEQGIAAMAGFFTAGPMGSVAAWGAIRGLQGKWAPWFILGVPAAIAINVVQLTIIGAILSTMPSEEAPEGTQAASRHRTIQSGKPVSPN